MRSIPENYLPKTLSQKDRREQIGNIKKSRKAYTHGEFAERSQLGSFHSRRSPHVKRAEKLYHKSFSGLLADGVPGCKWSKLKEILKKGKGAFYSSGSRPNQTQASWANARLASAISGGKAAVVDQNILRRACKYDSVARRLLRKRLKKVLPGAPSRAESPTKHSPRAGKTGSHKSGRAPLRRRKRT